MPMSGLFILSVRYSVSGSSDSSVALCVQGAGLFKNITQGMRQSRILVACVSDEVGNTPPPFSTNTVVTDTIGTMMAVCRIVMVIVTTMVVVMMMTVVGMMPTTAMVVRLMMMTVVGMLTTTP